MGFVLLLACGALPLVLVWRRTPGGAALGFLWLALVATWPLVERPDQLLMTGKGGRDALIFVWNHWWTRQALLEAGTNPFICQLLYAPHGVGLVLHSYGLPYLLLTLPLQLLQGGLSGLILAYNGAVVLSFWASGYLTCRLAGRVTDDRWAAAVAGLVFMGCTYRYGNIVRLHALATELLPLMLLALFLLMRRPDWRSGVLLGLVAGTAALLSPEYAIFGGLAGLLFLGWDVAGQPEWRLAVRNRAGPLALAALVTGLLVLPAILVVLERPPTGAAASRDLLEYFSADALDLFLPSGWHPQYGEAMNAIGRQWHRGIEPFHLGASLMALLLAGYGGWMARRRPALRPWVVLGVGAAVLMLGPTLHVAGERWAVPLPYRLLESLPLLDQARMPMRFVVPVHLAIAVLAGAGLAELRRGRSRRLRAGLLMGAVAVIGFESLAIPLAPEPVRIPELYYQLADQRGALIDWPPAEGPEIMAEALHQTAHGRPLVQPLPWVIPRADAVARQTVDGPHWEELVTRVLTPHPEAPPPRPEDAQLLKELDVRWVVLRPTLGRAGQREVARRLEQCGFARWQRTDGYLVLHRGEGSGRADVTGGDR